MFLPYPLPTCPRPQHLTDFSSQSAPKISVCSAKDLVAISPLDLITHLKFLLILVSGLFGVMLLGAALAGARDRLDARIVMRKIKDAKCGFEAIKVDGGGKSRAIRVGEEQDPAAVWTWMLYQERLEGDVFCVTGPIVNVCAVVGLPFSRMRTSIPEARARAYPTTLQYVQLLLVPAGAEKCSKTPPTKPVSHVATKSVPPLARDSQEILPGRTAEMVGRRGGLSSAWLKTQLARPDRGEVVKAVHAMWGRTEASRAGQAWARRLLVGGRRGSRQEARISSALVRRASGVRDHTQPKTAPQFTRAASGSFGGEGLSSAGAYTL